jgi:DNA-binding beta-propeller fold protein YncE
MMTLAVLLLPAMLISQQDSSGLVWPSPPDRGRIKHLRTIASMGTEGDHKGFFAKIVGFLFGGDRRRQWFVQPVGIALSPTGLIVVTDPGVRGIHVLDLEKNEYDFIGATKFGELRSPVGCAFADDGTLYVTDSERGEVLVFNRDREAIQQIQTHLKRPTGVQIKGPNLYIVDAGAHTVVILDRAGNFLKSFGTRGAGAGEFNYPTALTVRDSIAVVDALNYRIQMFGLDGVFGSSFGDIGNVAGRFAAPKSIAFDSDGNRYVTDALMDNIQIFNRASQLLLIVGKKGAQDGEFSSPNGIAIDRQDRLYVVDGLNRRLQIFQYMK